MQQNALEGAKFKLYYKNNSDSFPQAEWVGDSGDDHTLKPVKDSTDINSPAQIVINDLPYGRVYKLEESHAPDGFIIKTKEFYFKIDENGTVALCDKDGNTTQPVVPADPDTEGNEDPSEETVGNPVEYEGIEFDEENDFTFTVKNTPGAELPMTGGPGTKLFTILGSILMCLGGALLFRRRQVIFGN